MHELWYHSWAPCYLSIIIVQLFKEVERRAFFTALIWIEALWNIISIIIGPELIWAWKSTMALAVAGGDKLCGTHIAYLVVKGLCFGIAGEYFISWNIKQKKTKKKHTGHFFLKTSRRKTICCINLPHHSASIEPFLHSSFSREDPGDGNAKPRSILSPETLISY